MRQALKRRRRNSVIHMVRSWQPAASLVREVKGVDWKTACASAQQESIEASKEEERRRCSPRPVARRRTS